MRGVKRCLTQCAFSYSLEESVTKNLLGCLAVLDEQQDTNDDQPVVHARIRLGTVKVTETAATKVSSRVGMSLTTPEVSWKACGPHVLESSTDTEEDHGQSPVRHSHGIFLIHPAAEESGAQGRVDGNIGEEEASGRVPTPRVEPPGAECEHQEAGDVPRRSAVRQDNHKDVDSVRLQIDSTGHPQSPTREGQVAHLHRVVSGHPQQIPNAVEASQSRSRLLGSTQIGVSIQCGKLFEVLCVDCAEDDARESKANSKGDTHADRARDQGASVSRG